MTATESPAPPPPYDSTSQSPQSVAVSITADPDTKNVLVTLTPPKEPAHGKRAPVDICCVIDVSGSMDAHATLPPTAPGAAVENTGLTILDISKHAMKTIISTMTDEDRVCVVTFNDRAQVVVGLTTTDTAGKASVVKVVENLRTEGSTNLWDGLKCGMTVLTEATETTGQTMRSGSIFLLTDGQPNVVPPRGHIPMLQSFLDSNPCNFRINTFGFGYSLDSQLLLEIAELGGGNYGFIPDSGMVGTVFVHAIANQYATLAKSSLYIELPDDAGITATVIGGLPFVETSWGLHIKTGDIQYGQTRDICLSLSGLPTSDKVKIIATLRYRPWWLDPSKPEEKVSATLAGPWAMLDPQTKENIACHYHRLTFVHAIRTLSRNANEATSEASKQKFSTIVEAINSGIPNCAPAVALAEDIAGQVIIALSDTKQYTRWGQHYLPSLGRSHLRQQCSNFKDKGLEVYGSQSPLFVKCRDELDKAFDDIPPPKPSAPINPSWGGSGRGRGGAAPQAPRKNITSMSYWNSRSNPCFSGDSMIVVGCGTKSVPVETLRRGASVLTLAGPRKVAAIVRTAMKWGEADLCQFGSLWVTPWHPVAPQAGKGSWAFPSDLTKTQRLACDAIYSVLLEPDTNPDAHTVLMAGMACVTLGHGLSDTSVADVRAHAFLGNYSKVLETLRFLPGFGDESGVVHCGGVMKGADGMVCAFVPPDIEPFNIVSTYQIIVPAIV